MAFLEGLADLLRDSPVAKAVGAGRYGEGNDPYVQALQNAGTHNYPTPGSKEDKGQAQRYNATRLAAKKYGPLPLLTNAFHELFLSPFAEGEGRPSWDRWQAGNQGVTDEVVQAGDSGEAPRYRRIR